MPGKAEKIRKPISDAQLRLELIKLFNSGNTGKANSYELLRTRFKLEKQRCLKAYDTAYADWAKIKAGAEAEQIHANTVEGIKSGLKTKIERIGDIQKQIDELKQKLAANQDYKYMVLGGKVQKVVCEIDLSTRAYIHKTIKDLESEINKMEGNYAPVKSEVTGKDGAPVELKQIIKIGDKEIEF